VAVYRRDDFAFPPARGRRGVEFGPDGSFVDWAIGRGDAPEPRRGRWQSSGVITRAGAMPGTATTAGRIATVTPDRLELTWQE
jgi:hypothetical protein